MGDTFKCEMILKEAAEELADAIGATVSIHIGYMEWWAVTPTRTIGSVSFEPFRNTSIKIVADVTRAIGE